MQWRRAILAAAVGRLTVGVCGATPATGTWEATAETTDRLLPAGVPNALSLALAIGITFVVVGTPGVLLAAGVILTSRRFAWPSNRCGQCGYDLTGNVNGRCPECREAV